MSCILCTSTDEPCPEHPAPPAEAPPRSLSDRERIEALEVLVHDLRNRVWWLERREQASGEP